MYIKTANPKVRRKLWKLAQGLCALCGDHVEYERMHLDHRIARCHGGLTTLDNLQVTHPGCNLRKALNERRLRTEPNMVRMSVAIKPEQIAAVDLACSELDISRSAFARAALDELFSRFGQST